MMKNVFLFIAVATLLFSCSKKDNNAPSGTPHKVVFKAVISGGGTIDNAVYGVDDNITTKTSLSGTSWSSEEINAPAGSVGASIAVGGEGTQASSVLKVQIYVDGELKKEGTSTGEVLSAQATYRF